MRYPRQLIYLAAIALGVGCNSRPTTVAVQGEVSYEGQPVKSGKIDFVPTDNTPGWSTGAVIASGRYEISHKWGLLPEGVYIVQITGSRKTGRTEPNRMEKGGPPIEVTENYIPDTYNRQSALKIHVADCPDKNKIDFHLPTKQ